MTSTIKAFIINNLITLGMALAATAFGGPLLGGIVLVSGIAVDLFVAKSK